MRAKACRKESSRLGSVGRFHSQRHASTEDQASQGGQRGLPPSFAAPFGPRHGGVAAHGPPSCNRGLRAHPGGSQPVRKRSSDKRREEARASSPDPALLVSERGIPPRLHSLELRSGRPSTPVTGTAGLPSRRRHPRRRRCPQASRDVLTAACRAGDRKRNSTRGPAARAGPAARSGTWPRARAGFAPRRCRRGAERCA